jgi:hypothetical protein
VTTAQFSNCYDYSEYTASDHANDWGDLAKTQFPWVSLGNLPNEVVGEPPGFHIFAEIPAIVVLKLL